jgi:nitroreductase
VEFYDVVASRYSCRRYLDRPVEEATLLRILEAARLAPSANNRQESRFVVVACAETDERVMSSGFRADVVDVTIAMEHVALAATAEGLGTCWIGAFDQEPVRRAIGAPDSVPIVHLMTLGYPADEPRLKSRLPLEILYMPERYRADR